MPRKILLLLIVAGCLSTTARADFTSVDDFGDLLFWAGSGTNQAALVAFFDDPGFGDDGLPAAVAWGYRWDGAKTQAEMLFSLAGAITVTGSPPSPPAPAPGSDPRLAVDVSYYSSPWGSGYLITSLRYDQVGLPGPWQQVERTLDALAPPPPDGFIDVAPYRSVPGSGGAWPSGGVLDLIADTGISDTPLADGAWYGFVEAKYAYVPDTDPLVWLGFPSAFAFTQPVAAVPEPAGIVLLAGACSCMIAMSRRPRRQRAA